MNVHLLLNEMGASNFMTIVEIFSFLQGRELREDEMSDLLGMTWDRGMECINVELSKAVRYSTGDIWDSNEIVPRTIFGEILKIQDC